MKYSTIWKVTRLEWAVHVWKTDNTIVKPAMWTNWIEKDLAVDQHKGR